MIIETVKKTLQNPDTKVEDLELVENNRAPYWCVRSTMYREKDGGMKLWFKYLELQESRGCKIVYLYEIKASNEKIINGDDYEDDIIYFIRADYKTDKYSLPKTINPANEKEVREFLNRIKTK